MLGGHRDNILSRPDFQTEEPLNFGARAYLCGSFEALFARRRLEHQRCSVETRLPKLFHETTDPELHGQATTHMNKSCQSRAISK